MTAQATQITFPTGRLVQGSLYRMQDKDANGQPLLIKRGPNAGKPTQKSFFALAISKGAETHWGYTEWGMKILAIGRAAFPQGQAEAPSFAWKIEDGDSTTPNQRGRKNCDREGFPGHWIVNFSSQWPVKVVTSQGDPMLEPEAVKLGFYIGVVGSVASNEDNMKPGVYMNPVGVAYLAPGKEIITGPDLRAAATAAASAWKLPPGVTAVPPSSYPGAPPAPGAAPPPPGAAPAPAPAPAPPPAAAPTPVVPAPAFIAPPAPPAAPPAPPAPPAAPPAPVGPQMTAKAAGQTYEAFKSKGWTDELLRQHGYLA